MNTPIVERNPQILKNTKDAQQTMLCEKHSTAGAVSQRACVFCGSRVVLYPITDALHIVHGPIGCAAYTWDIRGARSSGQQLHRNSFSTDLRENEVIFGGERVLESSLMQLITQHAPKAAFVYGTCISGLIGDDIDAVCARVEKRSGIPVRPVASEGFKGTKSDGYKAACRALFSIIGTADTSGISRHSINIMGDFNIAGETWMIREYFEKIGIEVVSSITGDGKIDDIKKCHGAALNVVQCSGSMLHLAELMKKKYGVPYIRVSYFGSGDMTQALFDVARFFEDRELLEKTAMLIEEEEAKLQQTIDQYLPRLKGKKATVYVGGAFKAFSMVKALRQVGMVTAVVGSQTGNPDDYRQLVELCDPDTIIVDDSNPVELAQFSLEKGVDLFIGGVKERPLAYKLGIGFCDHNHERKIALAGFEGMKNFILEVAASTLSPVWKFAPRNTLENTRCV